MEVNRYKIKSIHDFFNVPEDRLPSCLEEFATFLETLRVIRSLAQLGAEALGQDAEYLLSDIEFEWIDDGEKNCNIVLHTTEEKQ